MTHSEGQRIKTTKLAEGTCQNNSHQGLFAKLQPSFYFYRVYRATKSLLFDEVNIFTMGRGNVEWFLPYFH